MGRVYSFFGDQEIDSTIRFDCDKLVRQKVSGSASSFKKAIMFELAPLNIEHLFIERQPRKLNSRSSKG
jgi:hypothetical protein